MHIVVDGDEATGIGCDADSLQVQPFGISLATSGYQNGVSIDVGQLLHSSLHAERDATFLHELTQALGNVAVHHGQTLFHELDDGYLAAKTVEHRGELHADNTCTNDAEPFGLLRHLQQFGTGDYTRIVNISNGRKLSCATSGNDDILCGNCIVTYNHGVGIQKRSMPPEQGNAWSRQDALYPTSQLRHHLLLTLNGLSEGSTMHIGLGGYAAPVETGASHLLLFDDSHLQALLGSIFSGAVASRPRADNHQISLCH